MILTFLLLIISANPDLVLSLLIKTFHLVCYWFCIIENCNFMVDNNTCWLLAIEAVMSSIVIINNNIIITHTFIPSIQSLLPCTPSLRPLSFNCFYHFIVPYFLYKISREKFEPEPGFEPQTSGFLAELEIRRSEVRIPVLVQIFLLRSYNVKFPMAQTMGLISINNLIWISYSCKTAKLVR